jgi:small ligand-binding sensory domain FIST
MKWASALSLDDDLERAVMETARTLRASLGELRPDLVLAFVSQQHADLYDRVPGWVRGATGAGLVIGCSAGGVIGDGSEIENRPALSLTAASLPDVELSPFHIENASLPAAGSLAGSWERLVRVGAEADPHFLLLADPFSFDAEGFLAGLDAAFPVAKKIGGLASGARAAGGNALFLGASAYRAGLVGVALHGNVEVDTVVAQGCRPIGEPMFVTKCQRNLVLELDGRRPLDVLRDLFGALDEADKKIFRTSLFLGIVMLDHLQEYRQGDFLIRNLVGVDQDNGAIAVGAQLRENMVVQFHLRDAKTSAEDLDALLTRYASSLGGEKPQGSLLFSCLGRGMHLYGAPDHDSDLFRDRIGNVPLGGFFCNGEIGGVHGRTYLHGYTSSFGIFRGRGRA